MDRKKGESRCPQVRFSHNFSKCKFYWIPGENCDNYHYQIVQTTLFLRETYGYFVMTNLLICFYLSLKYNFKKILLL